jgi:hypothetical protein
MPTEDMSGGRKIECMEVRRGVVLPECSVMKAELTGLVI